MKANPGPPTAPETSLQTELDQLRARCAALEESNTQLQSINEALMNRVERDIDRQGYSFSLFQAATVLEAQVNERTAALQQALRRLECANQELRNSNEAAQAASRAKSAFLASMSHELRTPMNGVVGTTELLLLSKLDTTQQKSVETIRQSALSLLAVLNDILDFSKIEAGQLHLEAIPFELKRTAERSMELFKPQLARKGLHLKVEWPADLPDKVIGDPTRFIQILTNLIGNAIKFTQHGDVRIRASVRAMTLETTDVLFEVEDTGIGIKSEVIPRLFHSFTQADNSTTRQFGGTGLGLAIVKRLCELMQGDCGVRSEYGHGSCFWFALRFRRHQSTSAHQDSGRHSAFEPVATQRTRRLNILLVEDNTINQQLAMLLLESIHCDCELADNGRNALGRLARPHNFDVVLMDCQMPEMDGYEATRKLRQSEQTTGKHLPVIAITANAMAGDRELCIAAGMDDFLSKPFQLHELSALLDKWCPDTSHADSSGSVLPEEILA